MGLFSSLGKIASVAGAFLPGPVGSALSVVGSLAGGADANSANKAAAEAQMAFQQYNSDTAYQRATKDMIAAGLNPMLAYSQGGASTPSGSTYSAQDVVTPAAKLGNETSATSSAVNLQKAQIQNTQSSTALNTANVLKSHADAQLSSAQAAKTAAEIPERDVKSQFWRSLQPMATGAADAVRGAGSFDDVLKGVQDKQNQISRFSPFTATSPAEKPLIVVFVILAVMPLTSRSLKCKNLHFKILQFLPSVLLMTACLMSSLMKRVFSAWILLLLSNNSLRRVI